MNIIERFTNEADGVQALVVKGNRGFNVVLRDTDADETCSVVLIFPDLPRAIAKAREIVGNQKEENGSDE